MRQAYVCQAADKGTAETRQLHKQSLILLLNHLVLVLDVLQVALHGRDLQQTVCCAVNQIKQMAIKSARKTARDIPGSEG